MPPTTFTRQHVIEGIIAAVVLIGILIFFYLKQDKESQVPVSSATTKSSSATSESLGGSLYQKSTNPIENTLPDGQTVSNPINDAYKNPFD